MLSRHDASQLNVPVFRLPFARWRLPARRRAQPGRWAKVLRLTFVRTLAAACPPARPSPAAELPRLRRGAGLSRLDRTAIPHLWAGRGLQVTRFDGERPWPDTICPVRRAATELETLFSRSLVARNGTNHLVSRTRSMKSRRQHGSSAVRAQTLRRNARFAGIISSAGGGGRSPRQLRARVEHSELLLMLLIQQHAVVRPARRRPPRPPSSAQPAMTRRPSGRTSEPRLRARAHRAVPGRPIPKPSTFPAGSRSRLHPSTGTGSRGTTREMYQGRVRLDLTKGIHTASPTLVRAPARSPDPTSH
jgi:hypothetical protein